ncbi:iron-regulated nucleoid-associated protein Lsr2 [Microbacterium esteraromaticum]|nr:Lsr2 family protein [Microbacterium esteraromaticum]
MAKRHIIELVDDLDGTPLGDAGESLTFALDAQSYEIDLSPENATKLRDALAPFIEAGRKMGRNGAASAARAGGRGRASRSDLNEIRAWAQANGHEVSTRGRIAAPVVAAYDAAKTK